ncbi:SgcJ/EcaC family oxidoreductase [Sphaerisporangium corydalis]|uniref:SgcJ/EcaC family oxidoreductase n=1 Tax=Sphaerisporangium corydalis TaxID=1441875 RepID=A0ABV9E9Q1_9ACTN|nr:SgcJ/EcaC family oxidoreductase [Sphaerisporangium corydalis]
MTIAHDPGPILDLFARAAAAWAAGDATAYGELFTEDAEYITWFGQRIRGAREIAETHRALFAKIPMGGQDGPAPEPSIRFLRPGVAVSVTVAESPVREPGQPGATSVVTHVAVEQDGAWRIASFQNTRETPIPGWDGSPGPRP